MNTRPAQLHNLSCQQCEYSFWVEVVGNSVNKVVAMLKVKCPSCQSDDISISGHPAHAEIPLRPIKPYVMCDKCETMLDTERGEEFFVEDEAGSHIFCDSHYDEWRTTHE